MPVHVGLRFYPTEQELLEFYLYHKITENPLLYYAGDDIPVKECNLYGVHDPNFIWNLYGGDQLMAGQALYFFTQLKKASPKGSRFNRKIGSGAWQGEDGAKPVLALGSDDQILGFKKRFRYESKRNTEQNGRWIMHEFTINPALLGNEYSHKALDFVLCRIKRNESEHHSEKANLGRKPRISKQVGGKRAAGSKRKITESTTSPIVSAGSNDILQFPEFEGETEYLPDCLTFNVDQLLSDLDQGAELYAKEDHGYDGDCSQSKQSNGAEEGGTLQAVVYAEEMGLLPVEFLSKVDQVLEQVAKNTAWESVEEWAF